MPSNKQYTEASQTQQTQKIRCFANRFTNITLTKSPECPPASDIEKEFRLMQQKRDEQDKKLFGSKQKIMTEYAPALFGSSAQSSKGAGNERFLSEEQSRNLSGYTMIPDKFYHEKPCRNALGLVGGNEVSIVTASPMVDVESDLQGITRPNTRCNNKQYKPECALGGKACPDWPSGISYTNKADDEKRFIATRPTHLQTCQMNSYQGVAYPNRFTQETGTSYRF